jgi:hypothetical protein
MKALRNLMLVAVVMGLVTAKLFAGPIPSPLPDPKFVPGNVVKGQSTLLGEDGSAIQVDWIVAWIPGPDLYGYAYQLENFSTTDVTSFTIVPLGPIVPGSVFISPAGSDWDPSAAGGWPLPLWPADAATHDIVGEVEPEGGLGNSPTSGGVGIDGSISWTWPVGAQLLPGTETVIIGFLSPMAPTYGKGNAFDGAPTGGWGPSFNPLSDPLPVPSPEPTTILLLATGLGIVGIYRRKSRR